MAAYRVPKERVRVEIRVSNSRFIATVGRASTMREAQALLRELRSEMPDATHHVYAFRIGHGASVTEGMSDDGEPSGTAGPPAMAVLRGADVGDAALIITRYFGGTKLGTGGLVAAYGQAARAVLAALQTELKVLRDPYEVTAPYRLHAPLRRLLEECGALVEHEEFAEAVTVRYQMPREQAARFAAAVADMSSGQAAPRAVEPSA